MEKEIRNQNVESAIWWLSTDEAVEYVANPAAGISLIPPNFFKSYKDVAETALGCAKRNGKSTSLQQSFVEMVLKIEQFIECEIGPDTEGLMSLQTLKTQIPLIRKLGLEKIIRNRISDKQHEFSDYHRRFEYKHPALKNEATS